MKQKQFWYGDINKSSLKSAPLLLSKKDARTFANAILKNNRLNDALVKQKPVAGNFLPKYPLGEDIVKIFGAQLLEATKPVHSAAVEARCATFPDQARSVYTPQFLAERLPFEIKEIVKTFKSKMGKLNVKTNLSIFASVSIGVIANLYALFVQAGPITDGFAHKLVLFLNWH